MKITETHEIDGDGYGSLHVSIETDDDKGGVGFFAYADSPEDSTFHQDLFSAYHIRRLLTLAYEAGLRGEAYAYEFIEGGEA